MDRTARRAAALQAAATLPWASNGRARLIGAVLEAANVFDAWLDIQLPVATFAITADNPTPRGATMSLTFIDGDEVTLRIKNPVDAEGEAVTDTFTWSVDNGDVLVLTPADDTLSCLATPGTVAGSAVVSATASDGVVRTFAIDVTTGPLAGFEIDADEPVARPTPEPAPEPTA
jgi:hypothetical protein